MALQLFHAGGQLFHSLNQQAHHVPVGHGQMLTAIDHRLGQHRLHLLGYHASLALAGIKAGVGVAVELVDLGQRVADLGQVGLEANVRVGGDVAGGSEVAVVGQCVGYGCTGIVNDFDAVAGS